MNAREMWIKAAQCRVAAFTARYEAKSAELIEVADQLECCWAEELEEPSVEPSRHHQ